MIYNKRYHKHEEGDGGKEPLKKDKAKVIPKKDKNDITFANFLKFFPVIELPISITTDTRRVLSEVQEPFSPVWMANFVLDLDESIDEYTEYMACFSLPNTDEFIAIIYWEANLYGNGYVLATFSKTGILIDKVWVAGTKYTDKELLKTVCTIGEDLSMNIVEGRIDAETNQIDTSVEPKRTHLQLAFDGEILEI